MQFSKNARVKLTSDYTVKKGTIPKGSRGIVKEVLSLIHCYKIDFLPPNQEYKSIKVPEPALEKAD